MKYIIFSSTISGETVAKLISSIENIIDKNPTEKINLYFQSNGGQICEASVLLDYLDCHKDKIILVGNFSVESAAFSVFYNCKNKKRILPDTTAVWHAPNVNYNTRDIRDKKSAEYLYFKQEVNLNKKYMDFYRSVGATEKEIKKMENGGEVVIVYERFLEILKRRQGKGNESY